MYQRQLPNRPVDVNNFSAIVSDHQNPNTTTERYSFIPTTRVLSVLADNGWTPYVAKQSRVLKEENEGFQRHMVRLRHKDWGGQLTSSRFPNVANSAIPEICLTNAHGGTAAFNMACGLFELICLNGLMVSTESYSKYRVTHVGYTDEKVNAVINAIVPMFPKIMAQREAMLHRYLTMDETLNFAKRAMELHYDKTKYSVNPQNVLYARHYEQREGNLWNVFNRVQENIIKGGVFQYRPNGTRIRARAVVDIHKDAQINQSLWALAETYLNR